MNIEKTGEKETDVVDKLKIIATLANFFLQKSEILTKLDISKILLLETTTNTKNSNENLPFVFIVSLNEKSTVDLKISLKIKMNFGS